MQVNGEAIRSKPKNSTISQHWMLSGLMLQGTIDLLDVGMFNVAMPSIQQEFTLHFPTGQRGRILGIWNAGSPAGTIVGPPLGGLIIEHFGAIGIIMIFHSTPLFIAMPIGGMQADRWTCRKVAGLGMIIQMIGMLWLTLVSPQGGYFFLIPTMILGGFGAGLSLTPFNKEAIASLGEQNTGRAAGLYNMVRFTGAASSSPILDLILAARFKQVGGLETVAEPYQFSFMILVVCALLSAGFAALIPPLCDENEIQETITKEILIQLDDNTWENR